MAMLKKEAVILALLRQFRWMYPVDMVRLSQSQLTRAAIYPRLDKMVAKGLIERRIAPAGIETERRPIFTISAKGREALIAEEL